MDHQYPYTLSDRCAQANALGISYGQLVMLLKNGWALPPQQHPIRWPEGSMHADETAVLAIPPAVKPKKAIPDGVKPKVRLTESCIACGGKCGRLPALMVQYRDDIGELHRLTLGRLCDACFLPVIAAIAPGLRLEV